jgi:hypothetical protein
MNELARRLTASMPLHVAALMVVTFFAWGTPVPTGNEEHYLVVLRGMWDPSFLPNDWTFSTSLPDRWTFDALFGALALVVPVEAIAWGGRLVCWALSLWAILRIGRRMSVPLPLAAVATALWILLDQSLVGGEWMIGWFEAKAVAWVFLLHAIDAAMAGRWTRAAAFAGLSATFHPAVGVVGGASLALAVLAVHRPLRDLWKPALVGVACGLPGVIQAGLMTIGSEPSTVDDWRFLSTSFLRIHMDASTFDVGLMAALVLTIAFTVTWAHRMRARPEFRILAWLHVIPAVLFAVGLLAHATGAWNLMALTPYRLLPAISLLAFCLAGASALAEASVGATGRVAPLLAAGALLCLPALPSLIKAEGARLANAWNPQPDSYELAFEWIATSIPDGEIGLVPPWRGDATLRSRHGQVVHCAMPRYDKLSEWHRRIADLLGDVTTADSRDLGLSWIRAKEAWKTLSEPDVARLASEYRATYLVTEANYSFPLAFIAREVKVYRLAPPP